MIKEFEKMDFTLFITCLTLMLFGFLMVYTSSSVIAYEEYADGAFFFKKQILWAILAVGAGMFLYRMKPDQLRKVIPVLMLVSVVMLFMVYIPGVGKKIGGARRWVKFPFVPSFQPFEFVKLFYVLYLAVLFSDDRSGIRKKIIRTLTVTGVITTGLILQPDFGGTVIIWAILMLMIFIAGVPVKYFAMAIPAGAAMLFWLIKSEPYRLKRVFAFLNPWGDPFGSGFQTIQSFIAIGSGGAFGRGLGQSQQKFLYLPTPHTDYIFSIIGEEMGLVGTWGVLAFFAVILWRGVSISLGVNDRFSKYVAAGVTFMISIQAFMNIGVATGLVPPKGTTLPFLSAGGSSLLITVLAISILLGVSKKVYGAKR